MSKLYLNNFSSFIKTVIGYVHTTAFLVLHIEKFYKEMCGVFCLYLIVRRLLEMKQGSEHGGNRPEPAVKHISMHLQYSTHCVR